MLKKLSGGEADVPFGALPEVMLLPTKIVSFAS